MNFAKFLVNFIFVDEFLERHQLPVSHHAVSTYCNVVRSFVVLVTYFIFVNALYLHVHELLAVGFLQHCHDFRDIQDLVFHEIGNSVVYWLLALHFNRRQDFDGLDPLLQFPNGGGLLYFLFDMLGDLRRPFFDGGQSELRNGSIP